MRVQSWGRPSSNSGFTLVELLAAMTVLVLLLVMVAELLNTASVAIRGSGKHQDSDTEARLLFNRMAADIGRCVKRPDVDYSTFKQPAGTLCTQYPAASRNIPANLQAGSSPGLAANDEMALYSNTDGYFSGSPTPSGIQKSPVSLVAYMMASDPYTGLPGLRRLGKGLGWTPEETGGWDSVAFLPLTLMSQWPGLFTTDADYKTVGSQVVRFEYTYLIKATSLHPARLSITPWDTAADHTSINGFTDVAAIVVAIMVLDSTSRTLINNYAAFTGNAGGASTALFVDAQDSTADALYNGDIAANWNATLNGQGFAANNNIPKPVAAALRVYERYFYLDMPQ